MAPTKKTAFSGGPEIGREDLVTLQVVNRYESVSQVLLAHKWSRQTPVACIVLELSPDNNRVETGSFCVHGWLANDIKIKASALFATAKPGVILTIRVPTGAGFVFEDGLCSEYMSSDEVTHAFSISEDGDEPTTICAAEKEAAGVGPFCLRLVCHTTKATVKSGVALKYSVMIFPGTRDEIIDVSELAQSASWPGLELAEGEMSLFPLPTTAWQCPVLPMLLTGSPWGDEPVIPPAENLRRAIGAIMARSTPPDICKTRTALVARWERFANNPDEFAPKRSPFCWPITEGPNVTTGTKFK